ncbi:unnamed protein product [Clonostachys byssicola]|uniref:Amino acid permease/ SLC12A domain-containing protein n=1 Tax=Clonostachys byssicola TaxID=160290 RepID=A0A9N9U9L1_9HYPO|nr:unnamed protein product [Clonostachys byssicola]
MKYDIKYEETSPPSPDTCTDSIRVESRDEQLGTTRRGLKGRHIQLIALGGTIGTGLFVGSGATLAQAGPASLLISYVIMSALVWIVMLDLAEMTSYMPIKSLTVPYLVDRFVDKSLAFATGWNYWIAYTMIPGAEATAAAVVLEYWTSAVPTVVWITIVLAVILLLNLVAVAIFGETEFWFASIKILAIIGLIILGVVLFFGGGPDHDRIGFRYWQDPGAFRGYLVPGTTGKFLGVWSSLVKAGFSYILSPELITTTAGECQAPRRNIPKAARRYIYRLIFFYVIGALVIGVLVPYNDPRLLGTSNASASPFVLAIKNASIPVLDHVLNAVILTSAWSSGNSMLYAGSRLLYGMACNGDAPAIFKRCNRLGIPYMAVLASFCLGLLAYLNASSGGAEVFNWLATVTTVNGLLSWSVVLFTYLRFRKAVQYYAISNRLPFKSPFQPYSTYISLAGMVLLCITNGFANFIPGNFSTANFLTSYITIPIFVLVYLGHKFFYDKGPWVRSEKEMDVFSGLEEVEGVTARDIEPIPSGVFQKIWFCIC